MVYPIKLASKQATSTDNRCGTTFAAANAAGSGAQSCTTTADCQKIPQTCYGVGNAKHWTTPLTTKTNRCGTSFSDATNNPFATVCTANSDCSSGEMCFAEPLDVDDPETVRWAVDSNRCGTSYSDANNNASATRCMTNGDCPGLDAPTGTICIAPGNTGWSTPSPLPSV